MKGGKGGEGGQQGGPGGQQGGPGGKGGKGDMSQLMQGGGCQAELCCGHILSGGVWQTEHICNTKTAMNYENFRFKCVEGAKNLAASAIGVLAAVYYMA